MRTPHSAFRIQHSTLGFTLMEVLVALAVGGMAVAGAAALAGGLGDRADAIERAAEHTDLDANAHRLLRALVANLEPSSDSTPSFSGDANTAAFRSWCDTPAGWLDRCNVRLSFEQGGNGPVLRVRLSGADSSDTELRRGFQSGQLSYLITVDGRVKWVNRWSHLVPPTAIAVIIDADTLLLAVWGS